MNKLIKTIKQNSLAENLNATTLWLAFALSMLVLFKVLSFANVGADLTDEGYYFNWISNPWLYKYYVSQFGYLYHPIYKLLGDNFVYLRQANMVLSFGLSWLLIYFVLEEYSKDSNKAFNLIASAGLAIPSLYILMIAGRWVATPSYNSLNFQGCLIVALGNFLSFNQSSKRQFFAIFLIGLGGWLTFMAKPSTALFLVAISLMLYIPNIKKNWSILLGSGFVALVLLISSAFWIDGSIQQFIKRYQGGFLLLNTLSSEYGLGNLIKFDFFSLSAIFKLKLIFLMGLLVLGFKLISSNNKLLANLTALLLVCILFITSVNFLHPNLNVEKIPKYHTLIISSLIFSCVLFVLLNKRDKFQYPTYKLIILFLVMPYIFAVGTGNNYWQTAAGAAVFWVISAILILSKASLSTRYILVVLVFVINVAASNIVDSLKTPYRQSQSIFDQTSNYINPYTKQKLILSDDTTSYLNSLNKVILKTRFKVNTPLIDLTGHHPGTLYFMQAKPIGQAWTSGGYAGSYKQAALALNQVKCDELASAWLLIEPDGKRQISLKILAEHGLNDSINKYQVVAKFKTQKLQDFGSVNEQHPDGRYFHYLLKPIDVESQTISCLAYRKSHPSPFDALD